MQDDELHRLADNNKELIALSSDAAHAVQATIETFDVVFGLYPDKEELSGWGKFVVKGASVVEDDSTRITAIWCRSIEEASAMARLHGDMSSGD